jgi:hypothetical protein
MESKIIPRPSAAYAAERARRLHVNLVLRRAPADRIVIRPLEVNVSMDDPGVIDFVAHDPKTDEVMLVMVEGRQWGNRGELLPELQTKLSTYLTYALDGQLNEDYPQFAGKAIRFELRCVEPIGQREAELLRIVEEQHLRPEGITFRWRVLTPGS